MFVSKHCQIVAKNRSNVGLYAKAVAAGAVGTCGKALSISRSAKVVGSVSGWVKGEIGRAQKRRWRLK